MKLKNLIKIVPILAVVIIAASSCKKVATVDPIGDAGQTFVKITGGGTSNLTPGFELRGIDFVSTPSIVGVDVQRLIPNSTELSKTMTVVIKIDTAAVTNYNRTNGTTLVKIPNSYYTGTTNNPKTGGEDGTFTMTFKPGEFAKNLELLIPNATVFDPSTTYAIGLTVLSVDAGGKIADSKTKVVAIGAKNTYDGVYSLSIVQSGWAAYGIWSGPDSNTYPGDMSLITTGAASNSIYNGYTSTFLLAGFADPLSATQFGAVTPVITFNPATNKVVSITNSTPDDGRGRFLFLDPAYTSSYDPATKTIFVAFYLTQLTRPNQYIRFTMKYKGPR